jgi:hypothetical protein
MSSNPFDAVVHMGKTVSSSAASAVSDFFSIPQKKDGTSLLPQEKDYTPVPGETEEKLRHTHYGACILNKK